MRRAHHRNRLAAVYDARALRRRLSRPLQCNRQRLIDYPNLWAYTRELYQVPGIAETVNLRHIKGHYYQNHPTINPTRIVPRGQRWTLRSHTVALSGAIAANPRIAAEYCRRALVDRACSLR